MKIPVRPPALDNIIAAALASGPSSPLLRGILERHIGPVQDGRYRHWDTFRHLNLDDGLTPEERWVAVKLARRQLYSETPLTDKRGSRFQYAMPPIALDLLHRIDRDASGTIAAPEQVTNPQTQATYLLKSVVEEAIKSSQLEGASTTRRVAKDMLLSGRQPHDRSERMILNNYRALQYVRANRGEPITASRVFDVQDILTSGTLDEPDGAGRFRRADEHIVIEDETGTLLHDPPHAQELPERLDRLCVFANGGGTKEFMHPVVRAILVHFGTGYDHPFVDGNGRTARALFYWVMAREGYWLCEFLSISRVLKKARGRYTRAFLYTETDDNDATYFILHQLGVLTKAVTELHTYLAQKAIELREVDDLVHRSRALKIDLNGRQLALLTHALKNPGAEYSIESHRRAHDVVYATARADLYEMTKRQLLEKRKRGRAFAFVPPKDLKKRLGARVTRIPPRQAI